MLAAVLACGEGAVLSHLSAADHLGLRRSWATRTDVTVPRRSHLRHQGIRVHRSLTLAGTDVALIDSVPCTSVARTLLDIAPLLQRRQLERAIEQAHVLELYDHPSVIDVLERHRGQPGSRRLRAGIGIARPGQTITKSGLEESMLALCRRHALPEPEVNAWILLAGEHHQVDFAWRAQWVAVEIDSWKYHRTRGAFGRDRRRDQLLAAEGWKHARFTDLEVTEEQRHIAGVVQRLLVV